ncbi:MAG: DNA-binding protein Alba [Thermoproteota archaeon]
MCAQTSGPSPNVVLIGKKPALVYAVAALMQLTTEQSEVILKARGRAISKAVDVVEILKRRFLGSQMGIKNIQIGTETFQTPDNRQRFISTIEITVTKA